MAIALVVSAAATAQTADLVAHNGFEACWAQALTEPHFLDLLRTSLDGATTCVEPMSGSVGGTSYVACNTAACPGAQTGCPVTVHAGTFNGDFDAGSFASLGSADNIAVPIVASGDLAFSCTVTISGISPVYQANYDLIADGNDGKYSAQLLQAPVTIFGYNIENNPDCPFASVFIGGSSVLTDVQDAATTVVEARLRASTLGQAICPLTP